MNLTDVIKRLRGKRFAITGRNNHPIELFHGEEVFLNREPLNKSDPNAIAVLNTKSRVVGHLKRKETARIAPHIDYTTCIWETVAETSYGHWNTFIIINS